MTDHDTAPLKFLRLFDPSSDPAGSPAPITPPVPAPAAPALSVEAQAAIIAARQQEKDKLYKDQEKLKKQLKEAEDARKVAEAQLSEAQTKSLPATEQIQKRMEEIQRTLDEERKARQAAETRAYQEGLERYRSEVILRARQSGVHIVDAMVVGSTPQEIDNALQIAAAEHQHLQQQWLESMKAQGFQVVPATPAQPQGAAAPPSPYFVPPPLAAGYPSVVNPVPAQTQPITNADVTHMTNEDAVRNGSYAKNREALMASLRGQQNPNALGSIPRHLTGGPIPQVAPVAFPQFQQPQYIPPQSVPASTNQSPQYPQTYSPPAPIPSPVPQYSVPVSQPPSAPQPINPAAMSPSDIATIVSSVRAQAALSPVQQNAQAHFSQRFQATPPEKAN